MARIRFTLSLRNEVNSESCLVLLSDFANETWKNFNFKSNSAIQIPTDWIVRREFSAVTRTMKKMTAFGINYEWKLFNIQVIFCCRNFTWIQFAVFEISETLLFFQKMLHTKIEYKIIIENVGTRRISDSNRLCFWSSCTCRVYGAKPNSLANGKK
jgi:hypothetical protein